MSRSSFLPTPCPVGPPRRASLSFASQDDNDTTANIEFTRAFEPTLHAAKPRRRSSILPGKPARKAPAQPVTIFEDIEEDQELLVRNTQPRVQGRSLLGKPAMRIVYKNVRLNVSGDGDSDGIGNGVNDSSVYAGMNRNIGVPRGGLQEMRQAPTRDVPAVAGLNEIGQGRARRVSGVHNFSQPPRSRMSMAPSQFPASTATRSDMSGNRDSGTRPPIASTMKGSIKDAAKRRITIYAPEDTTVMTMHPGANNTSRIDDTFYLGPETTTPNIARDHQAPQQSDLHKPIRRPRKSLMAAPKRIPLANLDNSGNTEMFDICGDNTGKENVPPGGLKTFKDSVSSSPEARALRANTLTQPTAASRARQSIIPREAAPLRSSPRSIHSTPSPKSSNKTAPPRLRVIQPIKSQIKPQLREVIAQKRSQLDMSKLKNYPVISENFTQLSLFENDWLSNQEVAISEVINEIFRSCPSKPSGFQPDKSLRTTLLELYDVHEVATLHSRLQASLVYGALSAPESQIGKLKLRQDIGLRRQYITLLLDTYDEDALRAASQVIVGRQIPNEAPSDGTSLDAKAGRRELVSFLEAFFVQVGDVDATDALRDDSPDLDLVRWRKTMLRTLMLIWLLDQAKTAGVISSNLFKTQSVYKSSASVLRAVANMLLPSVGDITRALKQMNYDATHIQDPLDEIKYRIENLAVDLRDGIFITRLVEILLHCSEKSHRSVKGYNETLTIVLPDTTQLISNVFEPDFKRNQVVLSQHLKLPCISETHKIFNVQVALSALEHRGLHGRNVVGDITAKDIVDGHREKTMSFLWQLVSTFGLQHLVDWKVLASDISQGSGTPYAASQQQETTLRDWAATRASPVSISNLSTDFANGKAYVAILNSFTPYMPSLKATDTSNTPQALDHQLRALGCSEAFRKQLVSTISVTVPSKETTISNLAFLASRLLPLTQQHRAACTIQKAWRAARVVRMMKARVAKMRVGRECAAFAFARNREVEAAVVLQRAWRGVVEKRLQRWSQDVAAFQVLARGALVRKGVKVEKKDEAFRGMVLGGW